MKRERHIPVHYAEIAESLCSRLDGAEAAKLRDFAWLLENIVEFEHAEVEESLKGRYIPFCPDDDSVTAKRPGPAELKTMEEEFLRDLDSLFMKANYRRIERGGAGEKLVRRTSSGLRIVADLGDYDEFRVYYRGLRTDAKPAAGAVSVIRQRVEETDVYMRAATAIKPRGETRIYLKLFKDIPVADIESLLPRTRVKMRLGDKLKIGGSTGAAAVTVVRTALSGAVLLGKAFIVPLVAALALVYLGKTLLGFFSMRDRYRNRIIKDLFYQNLGNNMGVITAMVDSSEEQEAAEALLAYAFLPSAGAGAPAADVKIAVEGYLESGWGVRVDFEIDDAMRKIERLGIAREEGGLASAVPVAEALRVLDALWDGLYTPPSGRGGAGSGGGARMEEPDLES